jgi:hypothetical protein
MHAGKTSFGRPRRRWEDIRMDLRDMGWEDVDWIHLAQDREHDNEPTGSINGV